MTMPFIMARFFDIPIKLCLVALVVILGRVSFFVFSFLPFYSAFALPFNFIFLFSLIPASSFLFLYSALSFLFDLDLFLSSASHPLLFPQRLFLA